MEDFGTHHGSVIEEVSGTGIEALISVEKLRGTDFRLGAIGASKSGHGRVFGRKFLVSLQVEVSDC